MTYPEIVFASRNEHKYREVFQFLSSSGIHLIFGPDMTGLKDLEVEETGSSYSENALLKAFRWSEETGLPCLADDSGLEIPCLDGWPGLYSSRVGVDDNERNRAVLEKMTVSSDRSCRYVASFALLFPVEKQTWLTQGFCWGNIARQPSGSSGFGYDPLFIPQGYDKTFGVLGNKIKKVISHRAIAARVLSSMLLERSVVE